MSYVNIKIEDNLSQSDREYYHYRELSLIYEFVKQSVSEWAEIGGFLNILFNMRYEIQITFENQVRNARLYRMVIDMHNDPVAYSYQQTLICQVTVYKNNTQGYGQY